VKSGRPDEGGERGTESASGSGASDHRSVIRALAGALEVSDAASVPARLCQVCVDLLDITGASVSLDGGASGESAVWWSSDPVAAQLAEAQYSLGDGPCTTARALVAPVLAADLTGGTDARRWPMFAQRAVELGVRAVFSIPLGSDAVAIGSLDLYRRSPGPLSPGDTAGAFTAGDAITLALMRVQSQAEDTAARGGAELTSWLDAAESGHEEVHYATGMLMVQLSVGPQQALARLRAYAYAQGVTVTEAAREVLARRAEFDE
jgi:hypothetical protein